LPAEDAFVARRTRVLLLLENGLSQGRIASALGETIGYVKYWSKTWKNRGMVLLFGPGMVLQQDNAPCHTSLETIRWLNESSMEYLAWWPACSPDLNVIEHMWAFIKKDLERQKPKTKDELREAALMSWHCIPQSHIQSMFNSYFDRLRLVLRAGGNILHK
jgi:hypothetical protein